MKERIDTIPVNDGFDAENECPFCFMERQAENRIIRYVLGPGASYMEPEVRGVTDVTGFCREHWKKMYDYGNALGNALILQTYYVRLIKELQLQCDGFEMPGKKGLFQKEQPQLPITGWAKEKLSTCYICQRLDSTMSRYYSTFFHMIREEEFRAKVEHSKGFCVRHFAELMESAREKLPNAQREWFYTTALSLMKENLARVQGDLDWFIEKFDYRNASAPWKNSRDAVSRSMQKLQGLQPAEPPYKQD